MSKKPEKASKELEAARKVTDEACDAIKRSIDAELGRLTGVNQAMVIQWLARQSSDMLSVLINKLER